MKIRILLVVTAFWIRIYLKKKQQKLSIQRYENLKFQTVYENEVVCELRIA